MSDINQNVNINVNSNTQGAAQDIEKLERNIATLDGTINIVGGSVEVLAGGLALTGAVSEEQAAKFESMAVGAIAFADGTKRIIEGYRTLAKETKVLTVLQRIYNTVMKANPLFLLASVILGVVAGYAIYTNSQKESADATELEAKRQEELNAELEKTKKLRQDTERIGKRLFEVQEKQKIAPLERELKLMEARGDSDKKLYDQELLIAQERFELYQNLAVFYANDAKLAAEAEEAKLEAQNDIAVIRAKRQKALKDQRAADKKEQDALDQQEKDDLKQKNDELLAEEQDTVDAINELLMTEEEARILNTAKAYDDLLELAMKFGLDTTELEAAREAAIQKVIDDANAERQAKQDETDQEELDKRKAHNQLISDLVVDSALGTLSALSDLNQIFDAENEEAAKKAFQREKALQLAETIISTYAAAQKAFASQLIPGDPTSIVRGQIAAAVAIAGGLARVAVISAQKFDAPNAGAGGANAAPQPAGLGVPAGGPSTVTLTGGQSGVQNLQAVVLAGDVTTAQAQEAIIRNRRRFG